MNRPEFFPKSGDTRRTYFGQETTPHFRRMALLPKTAGRGDSAKNGSAGKSGASLLPLSTTFIQASCNFIAQ
jgi:hypothetical protein